MLTIKKSLISLISVMLTISMSDIAVINANASENELTQDELQSLIYAGKAIPESSKYYYLIGADAYTNAAAVRIDKTNASKMIKAINNYSSPAYIPDEASPNYVFPDNPLNEVKFTQVAPYKMTAKIALDSDSNCTGAFIGPKIMLTAAHCVSEVHTDSNGKVTRRTLPVDRIIPAQQCSSYTNDETESKKCAPYGFSELYDYTYTSYVNQDYWNTGLETNSSADWAVIVFSDTRYTEKTGYFGFKSVDNKAGSNAIKNGDKVRITGYTVFSQNKNGDKMYTSNGKITGIYNEYSSFTYDAGMRSGDSGAGIEDISDKINFQLIGVNSKELCTNENYEVEHCPSEDRFNVGFMINHEVYSLLNSLRNDSYEVLL